MPFHRLTTPGYFGGLPGTHDLINDPAANGDPGVPAPADGKKAFAPPPGDQNEGTYFVAFQEPAQAINVNRPARALAENTDFLDDIVHRDLAVPTFIDVPSGHGGLTSYVVPGDVYVGEPGMDPLIGPFQLFSFADLATGEAATVPGLGAFFPVFVNLIHDGASNDQFGNGFYTNPTINFGITVPNTLGIRIYYYVRGRLKDLPTGILATRDQHNIEIGLLTGRVLNLEDDAAFENQANTFIGSATQTFNGPITFANTMNLTKGATAPAFKSDDSTLKRVLIGEFRINESPNVYARIYKVRDSGGTKRGLEFTYNARWTSDVAPEWAADSTSSSFHPTRLRFMGAGFSFGGEGLYYEVLDISIGATWNESAWTASDVRALSMANGAMRSGDRRMSVPGFETLFGPSGGAPDAVAQNPYKLVFQSPTVGPQKFRIYAGNDDDAGTFGGLGQFCLVHNAVWNPATLTWSHDDNTKAALALFLRTTDNPNPGVSGLSGGATPGPDSHGATSVVILTRVPGAGTWTGSGWTKATSSSGHLRIAGEYGYTWTGGGKEMRYFVNPLLYRPTAGSSWAISEGGLPTVGLAWVGTGSGEHVFIPVDIPYGAKITAVFVSVDPITASPGNRMKMDFFEQDVTTFATTLIGTDETDGTTSAQDIGILPAFYVQNNKNYFIRVRHTLAGGIEVIGRATINYIARVNAPGPGESVGFAFVP